MPYEFPAGPSKHKRPLLLMFSSIIAGKKPQKKSLPAKPARTVRNNLSFRTFRVHMLDGNPLGIGPEKRVHT